MQGGGREVVVAVYVVVAIVAALEALVWVCSVSCSREEEIA